MECVECEAWIAERARCDDAALPRTVGVGGHSESASALALCFMALGIALGSCWASRRWSPSSTFRADASTSCTRAHWQRLESADSNPWRFESWLELGAPARTLKAATRIDQTAHAGRCGRRHQRGRRHRAPERVCKPPAARFGAGALLVSAAEIVPTLTNPVLAPSNDLGNCERPIAGVPVAICDDYLTLTRNPDATDTTYRERHAFLAVAPALLSTEAQRLGLQAELFLDAGTSTTATYGATLGATTFCAYDDVATGSLYSDATVLLQGTYDPASGQLTGLPHATQARCDYAGTSGTTTERSLRSASGDTLGSSAAIGFSDADAFDAAVCATGGGTATTAATTTSPAATLKSNECGPVHGYVAALPLADGRSGARPHASTGTVAITMERGGRRTDISSSRWPCGACSSSRPLSWWRRSGRASASTPSNC